MKASINRETHVALLECQLRWLAGYMILDEGRRNNGPGFSMLLGVPILGKRNPQWLTNGNSREVRRRPSTRIVAFRRSPFVALGQRQDFSPMRCL